MSLKGQAFRIALMDVAASFWRGLTTPSTAAMAVTVFTLCGVLVAATRGITPESFRNGVFRYFLMNRTDNNTYVSARALDLERHRGPALVIIGGSATRESITSESDLALRIRQKTGLEVEVYLLCTGGLTPWEALALAERVPEGMDGLVVMDLGVNRLSRPVEELERFHKQPSFAFRSEMLINDAKRSGIEVDAVLGVYFLDNARFFLARVRSLAENLVQGPPRYEQHRYNDRIQSERTWHSQAARIRQIQEAFNQNVERNLSLTTRAITLLKKRGVSTVLIDSPLNPRFLREEIDAETYFKRRAFVERYAVAAGVTYWRVSEEAEFQEHEFYDWTHVRDPEARERFSQLLVDRLIQSMGWQRNSL